MISVVPARAHRACPGSSGDLLGRGGRISIIVLVLPLIDLLAGGTPRHDLGALLRNDLPQFGSLLLSFVVIARAGLSHHRLLERVGAYGEAFLLINVAWVLTVVVLPFSTQVIADFGAQRLSFGIDIATIAMNSTLTTALPLLSTAARRYDA